MGLKAGRIPEIIWKRSVFRYFEEKAGITQGQAGRTLRMASLAWKEGEELLTVPVSGSLPIPGLPYYLMQEAANRLAAAGAVPAYAELALFLPEGTEESQLRNIIQNIAESSDVLKMEVLSICVETAAAVCQPVLSVTGIGTQRKQYTERSCCPKPGWDILVTGYAGGEGTAILSWTWEEALLTRYNRDFIEKAKAMKEQLSAVAAAAMVNSKENAQVVPAGEGGVFGALWELGTSCGRGFMVDGRKIPILQQTVEVCEFFDVNPYMLKAAGCLAVVLEHGSSLRDELVAEGIPAEIIGRITEGNDRILISGEESRYLEPYRTDEVYKVFQKEKLQH